MKPDEQQPLPGLAEPTEVSLAPAPGCEAPVVWVKTLAVHSDWPAESGTLLREIKLHRGLNILWAQPAKSGTKNRTSGHATGKTTFCRLIRYVLDDADSGTKDFRQRFQVKFPRGWVFAEIFVGTQQWLVGRPLGHQGYHPFARKGGSLADASGAQVLRGSYDDYQSALEAAAFAKVTLRNLSATNRRLEWDCVLQWLARDQEARFAGLLEWRHKDSDSESPTLVAADKENLVRIILGLVEGPEQALLREHAEKAAEHTKLVDKRPKVDFLAERHRVTLETLLGRRLRRTAAARSLDPSEKGAVNYFLGLTLCKLFGGMTLDAPWLLHLDVFRDRLNPRLLSGRSRPDLIGLTTGGAWVALESKGRVSPPSANAKTKAKAQAERVVSIRGTPVSYRIGGFAYFKDEVLRFFWRDPEPDGVEPPNAIRLDLTEDDIWRAYYQPILALVGSDHAAMIERENIPIPIKEADIQITVLPEVIRLLRLEKWKDAGHWCMEHQDQLAQGEVRGDGVRIIAGDSWGKPFEEATE